MMKILRLGIDNHKINLRLYKEGKQVLDISADTIAEALKKISPNDEILSNLSGIYVYRGPGGYSKLRSIWAFAFGLSYPDAPVQGYTDWTARLAAKLPRNADQQIIYPRTREP